MRVTGGDLRGFTIKAPKGSGTRPMSDRLKLTLYSMLAARDQPRGRVADLYAGSGALGIEALSRGAEHVDFVEQNAGACAVIRENLAHTRLTGMADVHKRSVASFIASAPEHAFDLILMDPPYPDPEIAATIRSIGDRRLLAPGGLLVVGHTSRRAFESPIGDLELDQKRCHGDSCISFYLPVKEEATTG